MGNSLTLSKYIEEILSLTNEYTDMRALNALQYRGHSDITHLILPSVARKIDMSSDKTFLDYEGELVGIAKNRYPEAFRDEMSPLNLLARLQHYGIPTRLLDVTENPLVALYFACAENSDKDGEVIAFINNEASEISYSLDNAIADSYRFAYNIIGSFIYLDIFLARVSSQPYFYDQKTAIYLQGGYPIEKFFEIRGNTPRFVSALQLSARQRVQQGKYILFPNEFSYIIQKPDMRNHSFIRRSADIPEELKDYAKGVFISKINEIPKTSDHIASIIKVPRESKKELLQQLATIGITKSTLFPDNIDIGCGEIADSVRAWNRDKPHEQDTSIITKVDIADET